MTAPTEMETKTYNVGEVNKKELFELSMRGEWEKVVEMYNRYGWAHKAKITRSGNTALHIAVSDAKEDVVEQLVKLISKEDASVLYIANEQHNTALHIAASMGSVKMCMSIAAVNPLLVGVRNPDGETPLFLAALHGRRDAFLFLHDICSNEAEQGYTYCRRKGGDTILHCAIAGDYFDLAYQITFLYEDLVNYVNDEGSTPLHLLACKPHAFKSGWHLSWWNKIIYHCIHVDELKQKDSLKTFEDRKRYQFLDNSKYPEPWHSCCNFFRELLNLIQVLCRMFRRGTTENGRDGENPETKREGEESTNETHEHQLYPSNYDACSGLGKVVAKAMMVILGLAGPVEVLRRQKRRHKWAVQIMNELLRRTKIYEYGDDEKDPQHTIMLLEKSDETTAPNPVSSPEITNSYDQKKKKNVKSEIDEGHGLHQASSSRPWAQLLNDNTEKRETPILIAAKHGVTEMVEKILELFPVAIHDMNLEKKNIVLLAVENRQPHVYQLLLKPTIYRESMFRKVDDKGNSALHLAATQVEFWPWHIQGAAILQMQWEIQWYEFVLHSMPPDFFTSYNNEGETPKAILIKTHKDLVREGSTFLTTISNVCIIIAGGIAAFTVSTSASVLGDSKGKSGTPSEENKWALSVYSISSVFSLSYSATAMVVFLSTFNSQHEVFKFGKALPNKLWIGFTALFISVASLLVSFYAGNFFALKDILNSNYVGLIYAAACLPLTLFTVNRIPLCMEFIWASFQKVPRRFSPRIS